MRTPLRNPAAALSSFRAPAARVPRVPFVDHVVHHCEAERCRVRCWSDVMWEGGVDDPTRVTMAARRPDAAATEAAAGEGHAGEEGKKAAGRLGHRSNGFAAQP